MNEQTEFKPVITVKNVLRVMSVLFVLFFFCPTFLVSCSGKTIDVSAANAMTGIKVHGEKVANAHPIMIIALLLPLAIAVAFFIKKWSDSQLALGAAAFGAVDFLVWVIFKSSVYKIADENYCEAKTTGFYTFNMLLLICFTALAVLVVLKKLDMETDLVKLATGQEAKKALDQVSVAVNKMSNSVSQMADSVVTSVSQSAANNGQNNANNTRQIAVDPDDIIGFCSKCGKPLVKESKFCASCGTPVPESLLAEAEPAAQETAQAAE